MKRLAVLCALVLALVLSIGVGAAHAVDPPIITGVVSDADSSEPIEGAWVSVYHQPDSDEWWWVGEYYSDFAGEYAVPSSDGYGEGWYLLDFYADGYFYGYSDVYYNGVDPAVVDMWLMRDSTAVDVDAYEPDDTIEDAGLISVDGTPQYRTIAPEGDVDYVTFDMQAGHIYRMRTEPTSQTVNYSDTTLTLFDDSRQMLDYNDDFDGLWSQIAYVADQDQTVYLAAQDLGGWSVYRYALTVEELIPGSIEGAVTDGTDPLEGIDVNAYEWSGASIYWWSGGNTATTAADGSYEIENLVPGEYVVEFADPEQVLITEWFDGQYRLNAETVTSVTVDGGVAVTGINAELEVGGRVRGQVLDEAGAPILATYVELYDADTGEFCGYADTDRAGRYSIGALAPGSYDVLFSGWVWEGPDYVSEWFDDATDPFEATSLEVDFAQTVTANATLTATAQITGTVRDEATGDPLEGVWVSAVDWSTGASDYGWSAQTRADGSYTVWGLATSSYLVQFDGFETGFSREYYEDAATPEDAIAVFTEIGQTTGPIDCYLSRLGTMSGRVLSESDDPLAGVQVWVEGLWGQAASAYWNDMGSGYLAAITAPDGTFVTDGLASGGYRVQFCDPSGDYLSEFYYDAPSSAEASEAVVNDTLDTALLDARLSAAGRLSGTVIDQGTARPVGGARVVVLVEGGYITEARTQPDGSYDLFGLVPGEYNIVVDHAAYEWVNELVTVNPGWNTFDAELLVLAGSGYIEGRVADESDSDISGVAVYAYLSGEWGLQLASSSVTDADGSYAFAVPAMDEYGMEYFYSVGFDAEGPYRSEWYDDVHDGSAYELGQEYLWGFYGTSPDEVTVMEGGLTTLNDAILSGVGIISGDITWSGSPSSWWEVGLLDLNSTNPWGNEVGWDSGDAQRADFRFEDLEPGTYYLYGYAPGYSWQYYNGFPWTDGNLSDAIANGMVTPIEVGSPEHVSGITLEFEKPVTIDGVTRGLGGMPLSGVEVVFWYEGGTAGWSEVACGSTSQGYVNATWLYPGTYKIQLVDPWGWYEDTFVGGTDLDSAQSITLAAGERFTFDAQMNLAADPPSTAAVFSPELPASGWFNSTPVTVTIDATGGTGEVANYFELDGGSTTLFEAPIEFTSEGTATIEHWAIDDAAVTGPITTTDVQIDLTPPMSSTSAGGSTFIIGDTISIDSADALSGPDKVFFRVKNGSTWSGWTPGASYDVVFGDSEIEFYSTDVAGNSDGSEGAPAGSAAFTVVDSTPPTLSISTTPTTPNVGEWYTGALTVSISAQDAESGVDSITFYSSSTGITETVPSPVVVPVSADGVFEFRAFASNGSGLDSEMDALTVKRDTVDPVLESFAPVTPDAEGYLELTGSDATSGMYGFYLELWNATGTTKLGSKYIADADGSWSGAISSEFGVGPGAYRIKAGAKDNAHHISALQTKSVEIVVTDTSQQPVRANDRVGTAIKASNTAFPTGIQELDVDGYKTVVIATAYDFPDALGGAALAGSYGGPLLLTDPVKLPGEVANEIDRLGATRVVIVGGKAVVEDAVKTAILNHPDLKGVVTSVERIAGDNRYQTAEKVARRTMEVQTAAGTWSNTCFVATGLNFPDALAAGPLASSQGWPLLLSNGANLSSSSLALMLEYDVDTVYILGGSKVVPSGIGSTLQGKGINVVRLSGDDRFETAYRVAKAGVAAGLSWDGVALATGANFPDALAGGVMQGKTGSVILLTDSEALNRWARQGLVDGKKYIGTIRYLGGDTAISPKVRSEAMAILQ